MYKENYTSASEAINDVLACAYKYDDKPHLLFSCVRRIAEQFGEGREQAEVVRLMEYAYNHRGEPAPVQAMKEPTP